MKKIFTSIFILSICCACSQNEISVVRANMQQQQTAWNNGDIAAFMKHYWKNDSLKFIGSKGVAYGWQTTFDNYTKAYPTKDAMGILKFTLLETTKLSKDAVFVIGKWELQKEKPAGGYFTLLWRKISGAWVIVADHTS